MTLLDNIRSGAVRVVLGSKSPRRAGLLRRIVPDFDLIAVDCDETYPPGLIAGDIALYLSRLKANVCKEQGNNALLITADTIVWMEGKVYAKPGSPSEAEGMLHELSGQEHQVYTGVSLIYGSSLHSFVSKTVVRFEHFTLQSIKRYVRKFNPLDKAGAYGIQDCLTENGQQTGPLSMSILRGSYSNVMGLPVEDMKAALERFPGSAITQQQ